MAKTLAIPCPTKVDCPCSDNPFANLSAESPDGEIFIGSNFGWDNHEPPLGWTWDNAGGFDFCESLVSQNDADLCSHRGQLLDEVDGGYDGGHWCSPGGGPCGATFANQPQQCSFTCQDGTLFTWFIAAGVVVGMTQSEANRVAQSLACQLAIQNHVCISAIPLQTCLRNAYNAFLNVSGPGPFAVSLAGGSLPPGLSLSQFDPTTGFISGVSTVAGNFTFTIRAVNPQGVFMQKDFTISVIGMTTSAALPDATVGSAYSFQFTADGGTNPYSFSVVAGSLPDGLTLSSDGLLSGTPTTQQAENMFTVSVTDASAQIACLQPCTLSVNTGCPAVIDNISTGPFPAGILQGFGTFAPTPNPVTRADRVFISRLTSVGWIENTTLISSVAMPGSPANPLWITYSSGNNRVYVDVDDTAGSGFSIIQVINADNGVLVTSFNNAQVQQFTFLRYIAAKDRIYALQGDGANNNLIVINPNTNSITNTVVISALVTDALRGVDYHPSSNRLYIGLDAVTPPPLSVKVRDGTTFAAVASISVSPWRPQDVLYVVDTDRIYVGVQNFNTNAVAVLVINPATNLVEATISPAGVFSVSLLAYNSASKQLYAVTSNGVVVMAIPGNQIICTVPIPASLSTVAFSTANNKMYLPELGTQVCQTIK